MRACMGTGNSKALLPMSLSLHACMELCIHAFVKTGKRLPAPTDKRLGYAHEAKRFAFPAICPPPPRSTARSYLLSRKTK